MTTTKNYITTIFITIIFIAILSFAFSGGNKGEITPASAHEFAPSLQEQKEIVALEKLSKENDLKIIDLKIKLETAQNDQTDLNKKIELLKKGEKVNEVKSPENPKVQEVLVK